MKAKKTELDVDFIGGQGSLTSQEEKALSDFLRHKKLTSKKTVGDKKPRITKRQKATA